MIPAVSIVGTFRAVSRTYHVIPYFAHQNLTLEGVNDDFLHHFSFRLPVCTSEITISAALVEDEIWERMSSHVRENDPL